MMASKKAMAIKEAAEKAETINRLTALEKGFAKLKRELSSLKKADKK